VGVTARQITINEWWNDGLIATDSAGDLYATWDTQGGSGVDWFLPVHLGSPGSDLTW
jgi:hypothetical protein